MFSNAVYTIIKRLNKAQKDLVVLKLKSNTNLKLLKLFEIINNCDADNLDQETLFDKVYDITSHKEKDDLLNNDLEQLRTILDDELIKIVIEEELRNNKSYKSRMRLFAYRQFDLNNLFEENYEEAIELANQQLAYEDVVTIQQWALNVAYHQKLPSLETYNEKSEFFKTLSEECSSSLSNYTAAILRSNQFFESFSYHYHHQLLGKKAVQLPLIYAPSIVLKDNTLSLYHYYRTLAIYNSGSDSLHYFLEAYKIVSNFPHKNEAIYELILNTLMNIGRSYQQVGNYPLSLSYLTKGIEEYLPSLPHYTSVEKLYANYILALLNVFNYSKALQTVEEVQEKFATPQYIHNWFTIYKAMCYIGLKDINNIRPVLPDNFTEIPPQHQLYQKLLLCFELYMFDKAEYSAKELDKLKKDKLYIDINPATKRIIQYLGNALAVLYKPAFAASVKELADINMQLQEIESEPINDVNIVPLLLWVKRELNTRKIP